MILYSLLLYSLHLYDLLHPLHMYESLLNALYTTDGLLVKNLMTFVLQRIDDFERFFLANEPNSKFILMTVVSI